MGTVTSLTTGFEENTEKWGMMKIRWDGIVIMERREKKDYDRNMLHPPLSPIVGSSTACLHAAAAIYQWRMHAGDDDERRERPGSDDECSSSSSSLAKW